MQGKALYKNIASISLSMHPFVWIGNVKQTLSPWSTSSAILKYLNHVFVFLQLPYFFFFAVGFKNSVLFLHDAKKKKLIIISYDTHTKTWKCRINLVFPPLTRSIAQLNCYHHYNIGRIIALKIKNKQKKTVKNSTVNFRFFFLNFVIELWHFTIFCVRICSDCTYVHFWPKKKKKREKIVSFTFVLWHLINLFCTAFECFSFLFVILFNWNYS